MVMVMVMGMVVVVVVVGIVTPPVGDSSFFDLAAI